MYFSDPIITNGEHQRPNNANRNQRSIERCHKYLLNKIFKKMLLIVSIHC